MPHTVGSQGYAVVSCHVERPLDDRLFDRYLRFVARRPYGFAVASLVRPPDPAVGEREGEWADRVRRLAPHGPLGQHTHFGGRSQARPLSGDPAARVREESAVFQAAGLAPTWFCGGGWYIDESVAAAVAALGYHDCTGTTFAPAYLPAGAARLHSQAPAWLVGGDTRLLEVPTTHSVGAAVRAAAGRLREEVVHIYFHDYELRERRRRIALEGALAVISRRRRVTDLDSLAGAVARLAPEREIVISRA